MIGAKSYRTTDWAVAVGALLCCAGGAAQQKPAAPPERLKSQIGDVSISGESRVEGNLQSGFTITGPNTVVEVPDRANHATLVLRASEIRVRSEGSDAAGHVDIRGQVRYRITQVVKKQPRIVEGAAGHISYQRSESKLALTGGVRAELTDDVRLLGPARIKTGSLTIDMAARPQRFTLEGSAGANDLQFTPRSGTPVAASGKDRASPTVHISNFRTGVFQPGVEASFDGAEVAIDLTGGSGESRARLVAPHIAAAFAADGAGLERASATGGVHFDVQQAEIAGKPGGYARGIAASASYVIAVSNGAPVRQVVVHGPLDADVTDNDLVAHMLAASGDTLTVTEADKAYHYAMDSPKQTARFTLVPPPPPVPTAGPKQPPAR